RRQLSFGGRVAAAAGSEWTINRAASSGSALAMRSRAASMVPLEAPAPEPAEGFASVAEPAVLSIVPPRVWLPGQFFQMALKPPMPAPRHQPDASQSGLRLSAATPTYIEWPRFG